MMARSNHSNRRPDTLMQDRSPLSQRRLLQRTAGPYIGSFTTDACSTRADQCPLLLQQRHYCSALRSDAKGQFQTLAVDQDVYALAAPLGTRITPWTN